MPWQDWQHRERLSEILRAYHENGIPAGAREFRFVVAFPTLNAGVQTPAPIDVVNRAEADFVWFGTNVELLDASSLDPFALLQGYSIRIRLTKNRQTLGSHILRAGETVGDWIPVLNVAGRGQDTYYWPYPLFFTSTDTVRFEAINNTDAAHTVKLCLIGVQLTRFQGMVE